MYKFSLTLLFMLSFSAVSFASSNTAVSLLEHINMAQDLPGQKMNEKKCECDKTNKDCKCDEAKDHKDHSM